MVQILILKLKKINILNNKYWYFIFLILVIANCSIQNRRKKLDCPENLKAISMCERYDSVKFFAYEFNDFYYRMEMKKSIIECELKSLKPELHGDTSGFYFLLYKDGKQVNSGVFHGGFIFVNNVLKKIEIGDAIIDMKDGEDMFKPNHKFIQYVKTHQSLMSEDFRLLWERMRMNEQWAKDRDLK